MQDRTSQGEGGALWRTAQALNRVADLTKPLPALLFFTDPARVSDPVAIAERLPRGSGVVFRGFGRPDEEQIARDIAVIAKEAKLTLLIGFDAELAERCGAQGVHLPERALCQGLALRSRRPDWILTGAAHGEAGLAAARAAGLDAAVLSPVFESRSPSAGEALGVAAFRALTAAARLPVYALGGITEATATELAGSGAAGLAAIEGVLEAFGA